MSVEYENEHTLICMTDGSAIRNGSPNCRASYSVVWPYHPELDCGVELTGACTNNRGEYSGLIAAFEQADVLDPERHKMLVVYSDSLLLVNSVTKWLNGWKARGWIKSDRKPVLNKDLLLVIDDWMTKRRLSIRHVRAHTGAQTWQALYNDRADKLAKAALGMKI